MTDASKRRPDDHLAKEEFIRAQTKSKAKAKAAAVPAVVELPPGIDDLDQWSNTLVDFGKFANQNLSYRDMIESDRPEIRSYLKWIRDHVSPSSSVQLRDLADFLTTYRKSHPETADQAFFPGSTVIRQMKKNV